jgi:hypothetical protein
VNPARRPPARIIRLGPEEAGAKGPAKRSPSVENADNSAAPDENSQTELRPSSSKPIVRMGGDIVGTTAMNRNTLEAIFGADRARLLEEALEVRLRARWLAPGAERDALIRQARRCETGAVGLRWATSSELQPPR